MATLAAAAREAAARGAPDSAAAYLRRALEEPAPGEQVPELVWQLGRAEAAIAGPGALPRLERALALETDTARRAEIALDISRILRMSGEFPRALGILEPVLAELSPRTPLSERVEGELINVAMLAGQRGAQMAFERLARFLDPAELERVHDARLLANIAAAAAATNQPADVAAELAERALAAMPAGDAEPSVVAYVSHVLAYCDRFATARRAAEELASQATARGSAITYGFALAVRSQVGYREGTLREAEADARRCMEIYRDWPVDPLERLAFLVDTLIERGELDEAAGIVEDAPLEAHEGQWDALILRGSRGRLRLAQGDATSGPRRSARLRPPAGERRRSEPGPDGLALELRTGPSRAGLAAMKRASSPRRSWSSPARSGPRVRWVLRSAVPVSPAVRTPASSCSRSRSRCWTAPAPGSSTPAACANSAPPCGAPGVAAPAGATPEGAGPGRAVRRGGAGHAGSRGARRGGRPTPP